MDEKKRLGLKVSRILSKCETVGISTLLKGDKLTFINNVPMHNESFEKATSYLKKVNTLCKLEFTRAICNQEHVMDDGRLDKMNNVLNTTIEKLEKIENSLKNFSA